MVVKKFNLEYLMDLHFLSPAEYEIMVLGMSSVCLSVCLSVCIYRGWTK
jgi:hypothetical protein